MSKVKNNPITEGLSGKISTKYTFVQTSTGQTLLRRITDKRHKPTEAQLAQRERFTLVVQQAREALKDPVQREAFEAQTKKGGTVFGTAMKYFFSLTPESDTQNSL